MNENYGKIVQVMGPVVDVVFSGAALPQIKEALEVELDGRREVMEVAQHIGGDTVRCIMLSPSEGLARGMQVYATGAPILVPVGEGVLGRMFNVLGDAIDEKGPLTTQQKWPFKIRDQWWIFLKLESKSLICWRPMPRAEKLACLAAPVWARRC